MDWQMILEGLGSWLVTAGMPLVAGLIGLDLVLGVAEAIKKGVFEWKRLAEFYRTMVVPYLMGYLALQVVFTFIPDELGTVLSPALGTAALGAIVLSLGSSVLGHLKEIGLPTT